MDNRSYKVLVVEDEGLIALDISNRLTALGHEVIGAVATAEEAFEKASEADIVLMDAVITENHLAPGDTDRAEHDLQGGRSAADRDRVGDVVGGGFNAARTTIMRGSPAAIASRSASAYSSPNPSTERARTPNAAASATKSGRTRSTSDRPGSVRRWRWCWGCWHWRNLPLHRWLRPFSLAGCCSSAASSALSPPSALVALPDSSGR